MKTRRQFIGKLLFIPLLLSLVISPLTTLPVQSRPQQSANFPPPLVAIHVSELTNALESIPAVAPTPTGPGTTGFEWWTTAWHYFVMYESLKEALRSEGTPYVEITDADITAGQLLTTGGTPRYPIVFSLASEAVRNDEIAPLRNYVSAGGFLFVGSSAFTRNPDGTGRGNFALASEMGLNSTTSNLDNWYQNTTFTKAVQHRLVSHMPDGTYNWRMPLNSEEIPSGTVLDRGANLEHYVWRVTATDATVLANGNQGPLVATRQYGLGRFIYHGAMQPLIGSSGYNVGMYSYMIYRRAIEWAFESVNMPIIKLSPWRYQYNSAFIIRHDFENTISLIEGIENSALYEQSLGAYGDYYFCTGSIRVGSEDIRLTDQYKLQVIASIQDAVSNYGATIGSHNGGLVNPVDPTIPYYYYDFYHWGPDEALDVAPPPPGYASGKAYAQASINMSYQDIEGWLAGLDNGRAGCGTGNNCPRNWASPYFNSVRENSYDVLELLGTDIAGEQKISPFPHWNLSTQTSGRRYTTLSLPTSEWYQGIYYGTNDVAQARENHTTGSLQEAIDFYYNLGALINIYGHNVSNDFATGETYITYSLTKPFIWATNSVGVYDWWQARSNATVVADYDNINNHHVALATISGATDANTAVEIVLPNWSLGQTSISEVLFNGAPANPANYRTTAYGIKLRVGTTVTSVSVRYTQNGGSTPTPTPTTSVTPTNTPTPTATPTRNIAPLPGDGEETGSFSVNGVPGWAYRRRLYVDNYHTAPLPTGYSVNLDLDTAGLVTAGKLRVDGNDLRVVRFNGVSYAELHRVAESPWNTASTEVWFKTQVDIPTNSRDTSYYIYYGNPSAGTPPTNRLNVYMLWDDFEGTTLNTSLWNATVGTPTVSGGEVHLLPSTNIISNGSLTYGRIEMQMRISATDEYAWWGWEQTPINANNYLVFQRTPSSFEATRRAAGIAGNIIPLSPPAGGFDVTHNYATNWTPGNAVWQIDGAQVTSATTFVPTAEMYANFYAYAIPMDIDWVKTRMLVGNEPVVTLSSSATSRNISLSVGFNLISLPINPTAPLTSETMLTSINGQGGSCQEVYQWVAGGWETYYQGFPFGQFPINLGQGYFVLCSASSTWNVTGTALSSAVTLSLAPGYNLVGFPYPSSGYTASGIMTGVASQGGSCSELLQWVAGGWETYYHPLPFNDFTIEPAGGYFMLCSASSSYTP